MTNLYLDIETSGLSSTNDDILIVGMLCDDNFQQFVKGRNLSFYYIDEYVMMHEPKNIVTYNGINFDMKFLEAFGCETFSNINQKDLMHLCHNNNIKGGLKATEKILGIERKEEPLNYFQQKAIWKRWEEKADYNSLTRFLRYNEEDVMNLPKVEEQLDKIQAKKQATYNAFKKKFLEKHNLKEVI